MKRNVCSGIVAFVILVPILGIAQVQGKSNPNLQGTVLSVQKQVVQSPDPGFSNPTDAPLTTSYYAYDVSVRVNCKTYIGRYETPFNYLPSAFAPNQPIQLRMTKHTMYFNLPANPDLRMGIVHRASDSSASCGAGA